MNCEFINLNSILDRQLKCHYLNPKSYTNLILTNVYDKSSFLYGLSHQLNYHKNVEDFFFSEDGKYMITGGLTQNYPELTFWKLSDTCRLNGSPFALQTAERSKVKFVNLSKDATKVYSCGSDNNLVIHDSKTGFIIEEKSFNCCIEDMSIDSNRISLVALSCSKTGIHLYDTRIPGLKKLKIDNDKVKCIQFHPFKDNLLLIGSKGKNNLYTYDLRNEKNVFSYESFDSKLSVSYAKYNKYGDQIFVLRNYSNPILFNSNETYPVCEFDEVNFFHGYHSKHVPRKNCCFAGPNDEFVVAPSDSFDVFWWKIPKKDSLINKDKNKIQKIDTAKFILRSSCFQYRVSYNYQKSILASFGEGLYVNFYSPFLFDNNKKINEVDLLKLNESLKNRNLRRNLSSNKNKISYHFDCNFAKIYVVFLLLVLAEFYKHDFEYTKDLKINSRIFGCFEKNFSLEFVENFYFNKMKLISTEINEAEKKTKEEIDHMNFLLIGSNFYIISMSRLNTSLETYEKDLNLLMHNDNLLKKYIILLQTKAVKLKLIEKEIIKKKNLDLINIRSINLKQKKLDLKVIKEEILKQNINLNVKLFDEETIKKNLSNINLNENELFKLNVSNTSVINEEINDNLITNKIKKVILKQHFSQIKNEKLKELFIKIIEDELNKQISEKIEIIKKIKINLKSILFQLLTSYLQNRKLFFDFKDTVFKLRKKKKTS